MVSITRMLDHSSIILLRFLILLTFSVLAHRPFQASAPPKSRMQPQRRPRLHMQLPRLECAPDPDHFEENMLEASIVVIDMVYWSYRRLGVSSKDVRKDSLTLILYFSQAL
jgi:hypothetical protein